MKEKKLLYNWIWNTLALVVASCGVGVITLYYATGDYYQPMFWSYFENPWIILLNLLPVVAFTLVLWMVVGRGWLAFLLSGGISFVLAMVSFFTMTFRNDPLYFEDLLLVKEAGNMASKYHIALTGGMIACIVILLAVTVLLGLFCRAKPKGWVRAGGLAMALLLVLVLQCLVTDPNVYAYKTANEKDISPWSATQVYLSKGFVYPFLYSTTSGQDKAPDGYTTSQARRILSGYTDAAIPEDKQVNVVAVMLEAFQDFSRLGTPQLAFDLYADYHALEAESYSGDLVTNIFAGGTVDSERTFLTGFSQLASFRRNTNSYPWYFRSQGYQTSGMHSCFQWFYNRENINVNLGFEEYLFVENYFAPMTNGKVGMDNVFFPALERELGEQVKSEQPIFSYSLSYQGHGPYDSNRCWWGERGDFVVDNGTYDDASQYILDNYFGSVYDTIGYITHLVEFLKSQEEPFVLVLYGDHNPWMGDNNSVYKAMDVNLDLGTDQGFMNYYSTRYLIWANDAAKTVTGNEFVGEGPTIGPYFLMNQVFDLCGWEGPAFLQASRQVAKQVPVIHTSGRYLEDGALTATLSPEGQALVNNYNVVQYYWRHRFAYDQ